MKFKLEDRVIVVRCTRSHIKDFTGVAQDNGYHNTPLGTVSKIVRINNIDGIPPYMLEGLGNFNEDELAIVTDLGKAIYE